MKERKFKVSGRVRGWVTGASVVVLFCVAGGLSAMAGTVHAQASGDASGAAGNTAASKADLSCTYYDHGTPHPGTCMARPGDAGEYFCAEDGSKSFELQSGCKWKVERARAAKKEPVVASDGNGGKV